MPITSKILRDHHFFLPINVPSKNNRRVKGSVILWQINDFDCQARQYHIIASLPESTFKKLLVALCDIYGLNPMGKI